MKFINILSLASAVVATPLGVAQEKRQTTGITANDFKTGGCNSIIFVWARGSTEVGNMGTVVGPGVANTLKQAFPDKVAVQGIDYSAALSTNFLPGGADPTGVSNMKQIIGDIVSKCSDSIIVTGGYSQGAAVNHRAIEDLSEEQKNRIAGVVTFGDTQWRADKGQIPNFPPEKIKIICAENPRDTVCDGVLTAAVLAPHLSYGANAKEGGQFLVEKIRAVQGA